MHYPVLGGPMWRQVFLPTPIKQKGTGEQELLPEAEDR